VEIDFVFGVFFEIQEKVFESPAANDGSVGPDGLTTLNVFIKNNKKSLVGFSLLSGRINDCVLQVSFRSW
jgi:hypothetical protein